MIKSIIVLYIFSASVALGQDPHPFDIEGLEAVVVKDSVKHREFPDFLFSKVLGYLPLGTNLKVSSGNEGLLQGVGWEGPFAKFVLESGQEVYIYVGSPNDPYVKVVGSPIKSLIEGYPLYEKSQRADGYFTEPRE